MQEAEAAKATEANGGNRRMGGGYPGGGYPGGGGGGGGYGGRRWDSRRRERRRPPENAGTVESRQYTDRRRRPRRTPRSTSSTTSSASARSSPTDASRKNQKTSIIRRLRRIGTTSSLATDEKSPRGGKMSRTYELSYDGTQLYETSAHDHRPQQHATDHPLRLRRVRRPSRRGGQRRNLPRIHHCNLACT